jgi:hypothetical protein
MASVLATSLTPEVFLMLPTRMGGQAKIDADDYISGPPALVREIAASSVSIDGSTPLASLRPICQRFSRFWIAALLFPSIRISSNDCRRVEQIGAQVDLHH